MSMMKESGGLPSGPFQFGPPSLETSTKRAFRSWISAMGREIAIATVTGVTMAFNGRSERAMVGMRVLDACETKLGAAVSLPESCNRSGTAADGESSGIACACADSADRRDMRLTS